MRDVALSFIGCSMFCCIGSTTVASADLYGHDVNITVSVTGSPFYEDQTIDLGNVTVGDGSELYSESKLWNFDDPDNPYVMGHLISYTDIKADSIERGWEVHNEGNEDLYFAIGMPAESLPWSYELLGNSPEIQEASFSLLAPASGYLGDFDLWAKTDPDVEASVDALWMDVNDPDRLQINSTSNVSLNVQGIAWIIPPGVSQLMGFEIFLDFKCSGDIDNDSVVDVHDLLALVAAWGDCPEPCSADINEDQIVNIHDLLALVAAWGECP